MSSHIYLPPPPQAAFILTIREASEKSQQQIYILYMCLMPAAVVWDLNLLITEHIKIS